MSVLVVVQARMGSTRLPGKVLEELGDRPMLQLQVERIQQGLRDDWTLVVATSTHPMDAPIAELAGSLGIDVVRGAELDVLDRFASALDRFPSTTVVRLTGDCPLTDPEIVNAVVELHSDARVAYASNVYPRSFPKGLDVEVITSDALRIAADVAVDPVEREHVTPYVVRRPHEFPMATLFSGLDLGEEWWTVDRPEDLERLRAMVATLPDPTTASWREILDRVGTTPIPRGQVHLRPLAPPAPGTVPWVRTWIAERDGVRIGIVRVEVAEETRVTIDAPNAGPDVAEAVEAQLEGDVQITRERPT